MSSNEKDFKIPEKVASMLIQGYCLVTESCTKCKGLLVRSKANEVICVKCFCERANGQKSTKHGLSDDGHYHDYNCDDEVKQKSESANQLNPSKLIKLEAKENTGQSNRMTISREQLDHFYRDFYRDLQQLKPNQNSQDIVKYFTNDNS